MLLIRHAHVDTGTPPGRLCGSLDLPLSPAGVAQLAAFEHSHSIPAPDALYSSTLTRAAQTAAALARVWRLDCGLDGGLREIHCGRFEGMRIEDLERRHAHLWRANAAQHDDDFSWPAGESYRQFRARVLGTLGRIAAAHPGQRVAIVTHTGVVTQVLGVLRNRPAAAWAHDRPSPFTLTSVTWAHAAPLHVTTFDQPEWWRAGQMHAG